MLCNSGIRCDRVPVATFEKFLEWLQTEKIREIRVHEKSVKTLKVKWKVVLSYSFLLAKILKTLVAWMPSHSSTRSYSSAQRHSSDRRRSNIRRRSSTRRRSNSSRWHSSTRRRSSTRTLSGTQNFRVLDRKTLKLPDPKKCSTRTP